MDKARISYTNYSIFCNKYMKRFVCVLKESVYECVVLSYVLFLTKINIHADDHFPLGGNKLIEVCTVF